MTRFSIVIPTYNRAHFLGRTIESALAQTHPDVEVVVSDNASTDGTRELVEKFGDRVRYSRNETNIGMWPNLAKAPELVTGEYFSWLQDDDLIHRDFASKAWKGLSERDDAVFYTCWAAYSPSPTSLRKWTSIHGPVIPVNWLGSERRVVDGLLMVPLCFFESQALPPAVAFRTDAARRGFKDILPDCPIFNEQVAVAAVAAQGQVVVDPWIGAVHTHHPEQENLTVQRDPNYVDAVLNQKLSQARYCQSHMAGLPGRWKDLFRECLLEIPVESRFRLLQVVLVEKRDEFWGRVPPVVREMRDIVLEALPPGDRAAFHEWVEGAKPAPRTPKQQLKRLVPPMIWDTLKSAKDARNRGAR